MTTTTNSSKDNSEEETKWVELMGKDLIMMVQADNDENDGGDKRPNPEVGDSALIDISGYRFGSHLSNPETSIHDLPPLDRDGNDKETNNDAALCFLEAKDWRIVLGDSDVPAAIEMAVRFMKEGQQATVRCRSKYAYGSTGRGQNDAPSFLPPYSDVTFHVSLRSIWSQDEVSTPQQQVQMALAKKTLGNDCFKHEWVTAAAAHDNSVPQNKCLKLYGKAAENMVALLRELRESDDVDDADKDKNRGESQSDKDKLDKEVLHILTDCLNNIAAVHLRAKSYGKAKEAAANVLGYDAHNLKALCRAARAAMNDPATDFEEAQAALVAAEQDCLATSDETPEKEQVRKLRAELEKKKRRYKQKERSMYSKMFAGTDSSEVLASTSLSSSSSFVQDSSPITFSSRRDALNSMTKATIPTTTTKATPETRLSSTKGISYALGAVVAVGVLGLLGLAAFWHFGGNQERREEF